MTAVLTGGPPRPPQPCGARRLRPATATSPARRGRLVRRDRRGRGGDSRRRPPSEPPAFEGLGRVVLLVEGALLRDHDGTGAGCREIGDAVLSRGADHDRAAGQERPRIVDARRSVVTDGGDLPSAIAQERDDLVTGVVVEHPAEQQHPPLVARAVDVAPVEARDPARPHDAVGVLRQCRGRHGPVRPRSDDAIGEGVGEGVRGIGARAGWVTAIVRSPRRRANATTSALTSTTNARRSRAAATVATAARRARCPGWSCGAQCRAPRAVGSASRGSTVVPSADSKGSASGGRSIHSMSAAAPRAAASTRTPRPARAGAAPRRGSARGGRSRGGGCTSRSPRHRRHPAGGNRLRAVREHAFDLAISLNERVLADGRAPRPHAGEGFARTGLGQLRGGLGESDDVSGHDRGGSRDPGHHLGYPADVERGDGVRWRGPRR